MVAQRERAGSFDRRYTVLFFTPRQPQPLDAVKFSLPSCSLACSMTCGDTKLRGPDAVRATTSHRCCELHCFLWHRYKSRVKTYPQPAASPFPPTSRLPSSPNPCLLPSPLVPQSAEKMGGGSRAP
jgi:hypothetical protein